MSLLTPVLQRSLLLIHTFTLGSWVRCHHLITFHLNQGVRIICFWTKELQTLNRAWILSSQIPSRHLSWKHPFMSLMPLLLLSHQGFYTLLVLFLNLLNCSLILGSDLVNYGARLGHFFLLWLWPPRCQHQNCFFIFPATWEHLGSSH